MRTSKIIGLIAILLSTVACQYKAANQSSDSMTVQSSIQAEVKMIIAVLDSSANTAISDPIEQAKVSQVMASKQRTYVKLLPSYTHSLTIESDGNNEVWLLNANGFIQRKKSDGKLYKVDNIKAILSLMAYSK
ncbi:MAG: hypothetical protein V2I33_05335 [Kangiellaceae bacterium]|jgi:hypothetical protein|nr:hypothetical protein [Kangiellaceae bacterium]